jgi:methylmalonyl-CoA/ethylmalonyl-CoA epimerase
MQNLKLDHIGIAVQNLDESIEYYLKNFGLTLDIREKVPSQQVEVAFLKLANTKIELLAPLAETSTLAIFLAKRGPGMHHLCYETPDINAELARLRGLNFTLIDQTARQGAHNTLIAFVHPKSCQGVLTELCQYILSAG